ncbi:MAG TPA: sigma-70 family RNA polymerase sigma factor [Polyangia bacterium]|nr:sigma-70 family RNA polymerase sigma factor [Polyangia bacterium]
MALSSPDRHAFSGGASAPVDLDEIYRAHAGTVARWVGHLGGPLADVDDLVHEIFLVADRRLSEFRGDAKLTTWLYRITERVVRGRRRSDRIRRWLGRTRSADLERSLSPTQLTPIEELERRRAVDTVYRILDRLPEKYREVLILFELEGSSGEEIAALTGRKLATIWVHLHRARRQFLEEIEREGGDHR